MRFATLLWFAAASSVAATSSDSCWYAGPRVDCGWAGVTQELCEKKGCCWLPSTFVAAPPVDLPWCFLPNTAASSYAATDAKDTGPSAFSANLELRTAAQPELGPDIPRLAVAAAPAAPGIFRLHITDAERPRWQVPTDLFRSDVLNPQAANPPPAGASVVGKAAATHAAGKQEQGVEVQWDKDPFAVRLLRSSDGATLLNTTATRLVYKEQYLELSTWMPPSATLFGAGERATETLHLKRNGMPRTLWNHDLGPTYLQQNSYGSHPFVLALMPDGTAFGYFLLSSNAMDIVPTEHRLSWRVTGGVVDLFVMAGPTPAAVLEQLTRVVGRPAMMPAWALGWHQCKYGYRSVWEVEEVVNNYSHAGIPLEAIWTDIDHMDRWKDFTFDPVNFPLPEMQRFVGELAKRGQKWVPIVDPAIKVEKGYAPYELGLRQDVFLKDVQGGNFLGWVWPGPTHFPDFLSRRVRTFFSELLASHRALVPWAGMWIDMDEASNFCTGDACQFKSGPPRRDALVDALSGEDPPPWVCQLECRDIAPELNATQRAMLNPPYAVANFLNRQPLGTKGISVLATHLDGSLQYNTHNVYGLAAPLAIYDAVLNATGKRPFVLSRSSFTGAGAYSAHWTGDNAATWKDLAWSLPGVINIGLFGMPMAGADICGFAQDTTEELCARWVALGAFYPFSRSHSDLHAAPQEPYRWPAVAAAARSVLSMRYALLPYLYTVFKAAHDTGAPVMRPLWLNYPADASTHELDRQFMVGESLLVTPVLQQGATKVAGYFPGGTTWYDLFDKSRAVDTRAGPRTAEVDAPLDAIPLHLAGGSVIAMQPAAATISAVRRGALTVVVALAHPVEAHAAASIEPAAEQGLGVGPAPGGATDSGGRRAAPRRQQASGWIYYDDGESPEVGKSPCHHLRLEAAAWRDPVTGSHRGEVLLLFGAAANGTVDGGGPGRRGGAACRPMGRGAPGVADLDLGLDREPDLGFVWPAVGAVEVLGWRRGAVAARVETVRRGCGGWGKLRVVRSEAVPEARIEQRGGFLSVDLSSRRPALRCGGGGGGGGEGVRVAWEASPESAVGGGAGSQAAAW